MNIGIIFAYLAADFSEQDGCDRPGGVVGLKFTSCGENSLVFDERHSDCSEAGASRKRRLDGHMLLLSP